MKASPDLCNTIPMHTMFQFSRLYTFLSSAHLRAIAFALFTLLGTQAQAQSEDYKQSSLDGEFMMEVSRDKHEVKIVLHFTDATQYNHAMIEKTDELKSDFRQCAYVDLAEEKATAIEKRDRYPRVSTDSYYRLRTVTKDGIVRTYPPVRLPAMKP